MEKRDRTLDSKTNEKRYVSDTLLSSLKVSRERAGANARSQITLALADLKNQNERSALMDYYDSIVRLQRGRVDEVDALRKAGGKVVGYLCMFVPVELICASGAVPLRLDSGFYCTVMPSEQLLPSEVCPVVKSFLGTAMLDLSPYLRLCDVLICPGSCGTKTKLSEILEDFVPIWRIEVPHYKDGLSTKLLWQHEISSLKSKLEKLTGQKITKRALRRSIEQIEEARGVFHRFRELGKFKSLPISGRDAMLVTQTMWYDDLERWTEKTRELCTELEKRIQDGVIVSHSEAPRIMLAGSPIIWPNWKLPNLIEESGAVIVCDDLCSGDQGILSDPVNVDEWTMQDMLAAIADRYLQPITCPCFAPNDKRLDKVARMVKDYRVDGVVYHQLRGCYIQKIEFSRIRSALRDLRTPVLGIETDYTQEDVGQLKTRIDAFLEMIQSAKQNA